MVILPRVEGRAVGTAWDKLVRGVLLLAAVAGLAVFLYFLTADSRRTSTYCHTHPLSTAAACHPDPGDADLQRP
jgi:hypothetical protein